MKFTLTLHTDDEAEEAIYDAVSQACARHQYEMTDREYENLIDKKVDEVYEALGKFLENDCCLKVEFDLVAGRASVQPRTH